MYETRLQDIEREKQQMKTEIVELKEQQHKVAQVKMIIPPGNDNEKTLPYVCSGRNGNVGIRRLENAWTNQKTDEVT